jgi:hypothetical protein
MLMTTDDLFWAIYDEYDTKLRGGFASREAAIGWFHDHVPYVVSIPSGIELARVATRYEADLISTERPDVIIVRADPTEYRVLVESD